MKETNKEKEKKNAAAENEKQEKTKPDKEKLLSCIRALEELGSPLLKSTSSADVLIVPVPGRETEAARIAQSLRAEGIRTAMYLIPDAKMKKIYAYAELNSIPYMLTAGDEITVKDLRTRETHPYEGAAAWIREGSRH